MRDSGRELFIPLVLIGLSVGVGWLLRPALPVGIDIDLWSINALNLSLGARTAVPPGYPGLAALLLGAGDHLQATLWVSAAAMAMVPAGTWLLARQLGADRLVASAAAASVLLTPQVMASGQQITPDPLTALSLLGMAGAAAAVAHRPSRGRVLLLCLSAAVAYLIREHGLIASGLAVGLLLWAPGRWWERLVRVLALVGAIVLAPVLSGHHPSLPTMTPWTSRFELVLVDIFSAAPTWLEKADGVDNTAASLMWHTLSSTPVSWVWVALAVAAAAVRRRAAVAGALLVGVLPATPALLIYSQPRHVHVVLPVAIAVAAVLLTGRLRIPGLAAWGALSLLGAVVGWKEAIPLRTSLEAHSAALKVLGEEICEAVGQDTLWEGNMRGITWCPLPHNSFSAPMTAAMWKTIYIGEAPSGDWERVPLDSTLLPVYRLRWDGPGQPCEGSRVPADAPYIDHTGREVWLEPRCALFPPLNATGRPIEGAPHGTPLKPPLPGDPGGPPG